MDILGFHVLLPLIAPPLGVVWGVFLVRACGTGRAGLAMDRTPYGRVRQPIGYWIVVGPAACFC